MIGELVDLVLPGSCAGCRDGPPPWCPRCAAALGPVTLPVVPGGPPVLAVGRYRGPLRQALLRCKERNRRDLTGALAGLLAAEVDRLPPAPGGLWLVPAPSRRAAARARGGDHVARLCRWVAAGRSGIRVAEALRLDRRAAESVGLDAAQRAANLAGRVTVRERRLPPSGARVLLVDDVVTTGATVRACAAALAASGRPIRAAVVLCDATHGPRSTAERAGESYPRSGERPMSFGASTLAGITSRDALLPNRDPRYRGAHHRVPYESRQEDRSFERSGI
ncbi:ComF family protein [Pseudonocardia thermophila]|uniref:ComF family protein n=1 Tax=Pseudonocardia thermophila TaxID=1848 RepID=UPI000936C4D5|nr:phosphoribosyltransferase family protein [Pseudonocardia thermophila]